VSGFRSWGELYGWMAGYATTGWWGGAVDGQKLALLGKGLSETLTQNVGWYCLITLLLYLGFALPGLRQHRRETLILASWLLAYGAFFIWWEPDNIEFWIASLPPFYLLIVLGLDAQRERPMGGTWSVVGLLILGGTLLFGNYFWITQRGDANRDLQRRITAALVERSRPGDLLLVPDGLQELYLPYYGGRENVYSLNQALFAANGDWPVACALLRERIDQMLVSGQGVLIADEALAPLPAPAGGPAGPLERFGLSSAQVGACYEPYRGSLQKLELERDMPGYEAIPSAQALALGSGWLFTEGRWGWQALNAAEGTGGSGWVLVPGNDPALVSPPFSLDLSQIEAVVIRMAANTAARDGQVFFLDERGGADEARSLRWELAPGADMQTYTLPVGALSGMVGGIRVDPVGVGDGGTVVVEMVSIVSR
jgi:hypothetical protein